MRRKREEWRTSKKAMKGLDSSETRATDGEARMGGKQTEQAHDRVSWEGNVWESWTCKRKAAHTRGRRRLDGVGNARGVASGCGRVGHEEEKGAVAACERRQTHEKREHGCMRRAAREGVVSKRTIGKSSVVVRCAEASETAVVRVNTSRATKPRRDTVPPAKSCYETKNGPSNPQ